MQLCHKRQTVALKQLRPCGRASRIVSIRSVAVSSSQTPNPEAPSHVISSLLVSQRIAAARAAESRRSRKVDKLDGGEDTALFIDPYAGLLANWPACHQQGPQPLPPPRSHEQQQQQQQQEDPGRQQQPQQPQQRPQREAAQDVIATAHIDTLLLRAAGLAGVNRITQGAYRQVVLLGDALDSRPFRLPWPPGTAIFLVAPAEAHAAAEAAMTSAEAAAIAAATAAEAAAAVTGQLPSSGTASAVVDAAAAEAAATGETGMQGSVGAGGRGGGTGRRGARGPRPPPGCLLRRVVWDFKDGSSRSGSAGADGSNSSDGAATLDTSSPSPSSAPSLASRLAAAGFRADRLSVWGLQGLCGLGLRQQELVQLLAEVSHCAAYHSLLVGELPGGEEEGRREQLGREEGGAGGGGDLMQGQQHEEEQRGRQVVANALAECGLLGSVLAFGTPDTSYGRWQPEWDSSAGVEAEEHEEEAEEGEGKEGKEQDSSGPGARAGQQQQQSRRQERPVRHQVRHQGGESRWLFAAQQLRLSLAQMETYSAHSEAAAGTDEDFFDNFS
ncbi:hypothetical protein Agub_g8240 [Astrephomene gubernaculifera]|uniref:Uncharacterized protein n=1 Tax=Astrephomene gubernaculifera TaxID=47775 RepID=A0AAD3DRD6_9CHLO|nr:hypothetical protein Agub_g8240 [Astrephomene gubernaculifera]